MKNQTGKRLDATVKIGILGALAAIIMVFEFPIPFIAPSFYELDFSEVIVLLGGFSLGPLAAVGIEAVKIGVNLLINGSDTAFVGELANFLMGCSLVVPAALIYQKMHSRKGAVIGMAVGSVSITAVSCVLNAYLMVPLYAKLFHLPLDQIIGMGNEINTGINSLTAFIMLAVGPFNLFKGFLVSLITGLMYKKISPLLKKQFIR